MQAIMTWKHVTYLHSGAHCKFEDLSDGLIAVFVTPADSVLSTTQYSYLADKARDIELEVYFVTTDQADMLPEGRTNILCDLERELINTVPEIAKREKVDEWLFIVHKKSNQLELLFAHKNPSQEYNWIEYIGQVNTNFRTTIFDEDKLWRVLQIVPEDGEYLCVDCGYIEELRAGSVFPVCEVCLSGDPDGPAATEKGYWEYLS
jgi:hypothetical protein